MAHRRAQPGCDIKRATVHLVDEQHTSPIEEAQHLSGRFPIDLSSFLNFAFDSRNLITLWLVGLPALGRRLRMQLHSPLAMRIAARIQLEPLSRQDFAAMIEHGLKAAGAKEKLLTDPALEMLFRVTHGIPR